MTTEALIKLLGPILKVIEKILDTRLTELEYHDGFFGGRKIHTVFLEAVMAQELTHIK